MLRVKQFGVVCMLVVMMVGCGGGGVIDPSNLGNGADTEEEETPINVVDPEIPAPQLGSQRGHFYNGQFDSAGPSTLTDGNDVLTAVIPNTDSGNTNTLNHAPVVGSDGTVYVSGTQGHLIAYSADLQTKKWTFEVNSKLSGPVISPQDGHIYVVGQNKTLYAIKDNGSSHTVVATSVVSDSTLSFSPLIDSTGVIIVVADSGTIHKYVTPVSGETWSEQGSVTAGTTVQAQASLYDQSVIVSVDGSINRYAISDLEEMWSHTDTGGTNTGLSIYQPTGGTDLVVFKHVEGANENSVYAIDLSDGSLAWEHKTTDGGHTDTVFFSEPAIDSNGIIYYSRKNQDEHVSNADADKAYVIALDSTDGSLKAQFSLASHEDGLANAIINMTAAAYLSTPVVSNANTVFVKWYPYTMVDGAPKSIAVGADKMLIHRLELNADGDAIVEKHKRFLTKLNTTVMDTVGTGEPQEVISILNGTRLYVSHKNHLYAIDD